MKMIPNENIEAYRKYLMSEEKAPATVEKYIRDIGAFARWLGEKEWDKEAVLQYKSFLCGRASPASVNSVISSLNRFFSGAESSGIEGAKAGLLERGTGAFQGGI